MRGLMMDDYPLTLHHILNRGCRLFGNHEIVTRVGEGTRRYTYADFHGRVQRLANALTALGIGRGDRVGTLAWNHSRHLELYFAVPCMGAVLHTLNLRLPAEHLAYIINHAGDRVICVDRSLLPVLARLAGQIPNVERFVVMSDEPDPPDTPLAPLANYETLLAGAAPEFDWPALEERDAMAMCYTSGTTGYPKGVVYSHRAIFLHSLGALGPDALGLGQDDTVMPVAPMFHVNAWGLPFAATLVGAKQVYPGEHPTAADLARLLAQERVTISGAVPTVLMDLLQVAKREGYDFPDLRYMLCGGAAPPPALMAAYEQELGVPILQGWGMTETSPLGSLSRLKPHLKQQPAEVRYAYLAKQGLPQAGVDAKAVDALGREVPWDGQTMGELVVRGPWVAAGYYDDPRSADALTPDGWFRTGDIVTIDPEGYIQITDRAKDVIKSGGEWISSVDLENTLMAHPQVAEAAVIAMPHPRWQERPLACVVLRPDAATTKEELLAFMAERVAKWWLPDEVAFVPEIPKTSVGKFDKKLLRERLAAGALAPVAASAD